MKQILRLAAAGMTLALCLSSPLAANTIRLNLGYWPGDLTPELEGRYFKDDLLQGAGYGRVDLPWSNTNTHTIYPLGFEAALSNIAGGELVLNANYIRYAPEYEFQGFGATFVSLVSLKNYLSTDWEADLGYRFKVLDGRLTLTPKFGYRQHSQEFDYEELTLGTTIAVNGASPFDASAGGTYAGLGLKFQISGPWSFNFDYVRSLGFAGGSMTQEKTVIGTTGLSWERAESSYELDFERASASIGYDFSDVFGMEVGVRQEKLRQKYVDYFGFPIVINTAGSVVASSVTDTVYEALTDRFIWEGTETSTKGLFFVAFHYNLNL
ncbi:MAG: hypothetical protein K1X75_02530 [Leptospirales bacterium]|nr:hypothetical protein [Leptospirales bacterium]